MNMFIMLWYSWVWGSMFHCSFTGGPVLWKRSTFLVGLGKGISESLFGACIYVMFTGFLWCEFQCMRDIVNMLTTACFGVGLYTKVGLLLIIPRTTKMWTWQRPDRFHYETINVLKEWSVSGGKKCNLQFWAAYRPKKSLSIGPIL